MSLRINQNIDAQNAYRNLNVTQSQTSKSLEKLSSGFRINRAADDAAGLAISEGLRSQVSGIKVAVRNAQDGVSVVQTAEGALTETHSILQRMRDLSVQAANDGGLNEGAKKNIQDEMGQLKTELTRIADTTEFNGTKLLDGKYKGSFQVGANNTGQDKIAVDLVRPAGLSAAGLGVGTIDVTKKADTATGSTITASTLSMVGTKPTVSLGGNALDLTGWDTGSTVEAAAKNKALFETAATTALGSTNFKMTSAWNGTTNTTLDITFSSAKPAADAAAALASLTIVGLGGTAVGNVNQTVQIDGASDAITKLDAAIKDVSSVRSQLGAVQNRFEHTINNLNVTGENLSASESRIRDTDMAQEMLSFTRSNILSQAGTAMLAQAKSAPQSVLQLLQ